jgi:hypothetical protein
MLALYRWFRSMSKQFIPKRVTVTQAYLFILYALVFNAYFLITDMTHHSALEESYVITMKFTKLITAWLLLGLLGFLSSQATKDLFYDLWRCFKLLCLLVGRKTNYALFYHWRRYSKQRSSFTTFFNFIKRGFIQARPKLRYLHTFTRGLIIDYFTFLPKYYQRNENLWNDSLLIDFLQKKTMDSWLRQYVICTGFLFSEKVVFEALVRVYNDTLTWPLHNQYLTEVSNVASMLSCLLYLFFLILVIVLTLSTVLY